MHEVSIAMSILDIVRNVAAKENALRIEEVSIDIGTLSGVVIDALEFAMSSVKKDTLIENALINLNSIQAVGQCLDCGKEFDAEHFYSQCPDCNEYNITILKGKELKVRSISFEDSN